MWGSEVRVPLLRHRTTSAVSRRAVDDNLTALWEGQRFTAKDTARTSTPHQPASGASCSPTTSEVYVRAPPCRGPLLMTPQRPHTRWCCSRPTTVTSSRTPAPCPSLRGNLQQRRNWSLSVQKPFSLAQPRAVLQALVLDPEADVATRRITVGDAAGRRTRRSHSVALLSVDRIDDYRPLVNSLGRGFGVVKSARRECSCHSGSSVKSVGRATSLSLLISRRARKQLVAQSFYDLGGPHERAQ